jgi:hypothetical protein
VIYKLHGELRFSLATVRSTAQTQIGSAGTILVPLKGNPAIIVDRTNATQAGIVAEYNKVTALTTPLAGSMVDWHACYHGDQAGACGPSTRKVW